MLAAKFRPQRLTFEESMAFRRNFSVAAIIATIAGLAAAIEVQAGADKVAFPENYASGMIYMTIDRAQSKQVTAYYTSREAIEAAKSVNPTADLKACFNCHKPQDKQDFVFSYDKLKVASQ